MGKLLVSVLAAGLCASALGAVACSGAGTKPVPSEVLSLEGARCGLHGREPRPFVVDWSSPDRSELEAVLRRGQVIVRYTGCDMQLLKGCTLAGNYRYTPVTRKHDRAVVRDAGELFASFPIGASKLEAKLSAFGEISVDMTIVGVYQTEAKTPSISELQGDCATATHLVTSATTGAFELYAGGGVAGSAGGKVAGTGAEAGVGVGAETKREVLTQDGSDEACKKATTSDTGPRDGCGAILRIELAAISGAVAPVPICPNGWTRMGSECVQLGSGGPGGAQGGSQQGSGGPAGTVTPATTATTAGQPGTMIRIPGATFMMGVKYSAEATPLHQVTVKTFDLDATEVTVGQYKACLDAAVCTPVNHGGDCNWGKDNVGDHPINCVDHGQAKTYCAWVKKRLPTEEEWEFAAIGQTAHVYPWSNAEPTQDQLCWSRRKYWPKYGTTTCLVGTYTGDKSHFGVLDMGANVSEWLSTPYCTYTDPPQCKEPYVATRGGNFHSQSGSQLAAGNRSYNMPTAREAWLGFRCARSVP